MHKSAGLRLAVCSDEYAAARLSIANITGFGVKDTTYAHCLLADSHLIVSSP